jgi:hypothetical protein
VTRQTDTVFVRQAVDGWEVFCTVCGAVQLVALPGTVVNVAAAVRSFANAHRACRVQS